MRICKIEGCKVKYYAKGLCKKHYQRFKYYGDPLYIAPELKCSISSCNNKHYCKGYCIKHLRRFQKHGNPFHTEREMDPPDLCTVIDCENKYEAKGYCHKHYIRWLKYDDPLYIKFRVEPERHGMRFTPEYSTWFGIKHRCYNQNHKDYKYWGARGITVCDRWRNSFIAFYADMGKRPFPKAQIDRIDNNGNYEPGNCRWTTPAENTRKRPITKLTMTKAKKIRLLYCNPNITQYDLARIYEVCQQTISGIINNKIWKEAT